MFKVVTIWVGLVLVGAIVVRLIGTPLFGPLVFAGRWTLVVLIFVVGAGGAWLMNRLSPPSLFPLSELFHLKMPTIRWISLALRCVALVMGIYCVTATTDVAILAYAMAYRGEPS